MKATLDHEKAEAEQLKKHEYVRTALKQATTQPEPPVLKAETKDKV
ncbi:MAG TPA: hypothetical protein VKN18_16570 [Blastocatellia bacterium]|nr:hypothetical protein [Blastocatellia bacterium]